MLGDSYPARLLGSPGMNPIYLDNASTTPVLPEVVEAMRPFWSDTFGNPASAHRVGQRARQALESARETVAEQLGALSEEVIFTSGATEANNLAIFGLAGSPPGRLLVSRAEHPSILEPIQHLGKHGLEIQTLELDRQGVTQLGQFEPARLVSIMLANNETGVLQPVQQLARDIRGTVEHFHSDAVQAVGKVPVNFRDLGVTTLSLSAHKFHGPRGIGALLVRKGTRPEPLLFGGHQQRGLRPGTEPVALAIGLAKALELACTQMATRTAYVQRLRDRFLSRLRDGAGPIQINSDIAVSLPHIVNISFLGCRADVLLMKLDLAGVACSTGSACSSGSLLPSPVLRAMSCADDVLNSAMRFSFSHLTTLPDVDDGCDRIITAVNDLCRMQLTDGSMTR